MSYITFLHNCKFKSHYLAIIQLFSENIWIIRLIKKKKIYQGWTVRYTPHSFGIKKNMHVWFVFKGFIIAAFLVALSSQATPVKPCAKGSLPKEVRIDGCNKVPCNLVRGKNATAQWDFVVSKLTFFFFF